MKNIKLLWGITILNTILLIASIGILTSVVLNPKTNNEALMDHYDKYTREIEQYMDKRNKEYFDYSDKTEKEIYKQVNKRVEENEKYTDELREYRDSKL